MASSSSKSGGCAFVSKEPGECIVAFATYNILRSVSAEKTPGLDFSSRMQYILEDIRCRPIDVLALQECRRFRPIGEKDTIDVFYQELREMGYQVCEFVINPTDLSMVNVIAYKKNAFMCAKTKTYWLSSTPGVPSAEFGWGHTVSACTLFPKADGKVFHRPFIAAVTHFSLRAEDKIFEAKVLKAIREKWDMKGMPWILGGDFNTFSDDPSTEHLLEILSDGCEEITTPENMRGRGTWLGTWDDHPVLKGETGCVLDHIYYNGFERMGYVVTGITQRPAAPTKYNHCGSDHALVMVCMFLPAKR